MKYADTEAEKAAILAAPMVIKFGKKSSQTKTIKAGVLRQQLLQLQ